MFKQSSLIKNINESQELASSPAHIYQSLCRYLTLEDLFNTDAVYICAKRCASGFMNKRDTQHFMESPWLNSKNLCKLVLTGKFKPRYYRERTIIERGKERQIKPPTFECKVVQKVLCDYLIRPLLEPKMITTNYAGVGGRGTDLMYQNILHGLNTALRKYPHGVIVIADYSNYFGSINTNLLKEMVFDRYIKDKRIIDLIMKFFPYEYGCSLGNELSQIPASFFPSPIDHYMKDRCGIKDYHRYMDDSLAILPNQESADLYIKEYIQRSADLFLTVKPYKIYSISLRKSFKFCKHIYCYAPLHDYYYDLVNPRMIATERRKLKFFGNAIEEGIIDLNYVKMHTKSVFGSIVNKPNTYTQLQELNSLYRDHIHAEPPSIQHKAASNYDKRKFAIIMDEAEKEGEAFSKLVLHC